MRKLLFPVTAWAIFAATSAQAQSEVQQERRAKIIRLLTAIANEDRGAIRKEGVENVPYFLGYDEPKRQSSSPFNVGSLFQFSTCKRSVPNLTGNNWLTVQWDCPDGVQLPWRSTSTSFKFEGLSIVEIRTTPGAPIIVR